LITGNGEAGVFDPASDSFMPVDMITPRSGHTVTALLDGRVLIAGGANPDEPFAPILPAELFDPTTDTFNPTGSLNLPRGAHTSALLQDGRVLILGGTGNGMVGNEQAPGMEQYDRAEIYDPPTGEFTFVDSPMTQVRIAATAVPLNDGRVLVFGNYPGNVSSAGDLSANTAEIFMP
jgi:hypothetical protein